MVYLVWRQENGNFVGISACDLKKHGKDLRVPNIWDFHWDKDVESVADFFFEHFNNAKDMELRYVERDDKSKIIKTFRYGQTD